MTSSTKISTLWTSDSDSGSGNQNNTSSSIEIPPQVECRTITKTPGVHKCPKGSYPYDQWINETRNNPQVMRLQSLGNPSFTCVMPVKYPSQPICPYTDGKGMVYPLIGAQHRIFLELVPGLFNLTNAQLTDKDGIKQKNVSSLLTERTDIATVADLQRIRAAASSSSASVAAGRDSHPMDLIFERYNSSVLGESAFGSMGPFGVLGRRRRLEETNLERKVLWTTIIPDKLDPSLLMAPADFLQYMAPQPRNAKLMGYLWEIWALLSCPETQFYGKDGTCKPLDYGEPNVFCPPDYVLDETSLPFEPSLKTLRLINPHSRDPLRSEPRCVGKLPAVTEWYCDDDVSLP